jgi:hypothetical protein
MIKATSVDSITRLSFRKRKANHLLPVLEIWIDNKQQSSTKNGCDKGNFSLFLQARHHALDPPAIEMEKLA